MSAADELATERAKSIPALFFERVAATPDRNAYRYPDGDDWQWITWQQAADQAEAIAAGLLSLGIAPEDRVAILSSTRVEWILADFGVMCAGAATTTVYPTSSADEAGYILGDSGSRVAFVESDEQVQKVRANQATLPDLVKVVTFDGSGDGDWVITLADLEAAGKELLTKDPEVVRRSAAAVGPEHLATIIYTSGTTGRPKGVRLVQDCWTYTAAAQQSSGLIAFDDTQYLWLPLSHSFGKMLVTGQLTVGFKMAVDGRVDKIIENLPVIQPTIMAAAPRIFEKVYNRVVTTAREGGGLKYKIFSWSVATGQEVSRLRQVGKQPSGALAAKQAVADKLVFSKLRARFGGQLRGFVSGSAPLAPEIAEFFDAANMPILEGYGLTETSAVSCVNLIEDNRIGTVGRPMRGTEVKIAEDGEIMLRSPGVMRGYHNLPQQTADVLEPDGWLHTGDIGELDEAGHVRITDRKKDLIKTSGGKYVAPSYVEGQFKVISPYASQIIVHGHGRNFCTALISLDPEAITGWAAQNGLADVAYADLVGEPAVRALIAGHIKELNERLERWETIKSFAILPRDLTVEDGDLTPSMKLKRRAVEDRYRPLIDDMYTGSVEAI
jgi:long-chain acyl-CoA synthetase